MWNGNWSDSDKSFWTKIVITSSQSNLIQLQVAFTRLVKISQLPISNTHDFNEDVHGLFHCKTVGFRVSSVQRAYSNLWLDSRDFGLPKMWRRFFLHQTKSKCFMNFLFISKSWIFFRFLIGTATGISSHSSSIVKPSQPFNFFSTNRNWFHKSRWEPSSSWRTNKMWLRNSSLRIIGSSKSTRFQKFTPRNIAESSLFKGIFKVLDVLANFTKIRNKIKENLVKDTKPCPIPSAEKTEDWFTSVFTVLKSSVNFQI